MDVKVDMVQDSIGQMCPMPIAFMAKNMKELENSYRRLLCKT